jgi:hypothetical protein
MPQVIAFDVNETLLDLGPLDPLFEGAFGSGALRAQWFAQMLQLSFVGGLTARYVDFPSAQRAALTMLAETTGTRLDPEVVERTRSDACRRTWTPPPRSTGCARRASPAPRSRTRRSTSRGTSSRMPGWPTDSTPSSPRTR